MTNHPFFLACSCRQIQCTEKANTLTHFSEELELLPVHSINLRNSLVFSLLETKKSFMAPSAPVVLDHPEQPYRRPLRQSSPEPCGRQTSISPQLCPLLLARSPRVPVSSCLQLQDCLPWWSSPTLKGLTIFLPKNVLLYKVSCQGYTTCVHNNSYIQ